MKKRTRTFGSSLKRACAGLCAGLLAWVLLACAPAAARAGQAGDFDQGVDVRDALRSAKARGPGSVPAVSPSPVRGAMADWTVMYFISAKNSLTGVVDPDLIHMERVGSTGKVKLVAQVAKRSSSVKRYLLQRSASTTTVTSPVVQDLGQVDMGDWQSLAAFGKWGKANYPARRYMLVVWNHGDGWYQSRNAPAGMAKNISIDDETGHAISTTDLAKALAAMGGVDVFAADACLMQMAEVGYELRQYAGVVVGSENTEPAMSWNHEYYLQPLAENPAMGPQDLSQAYVRAFARSFGQANRSITQSAVSSGAFRDFVPLVNAWTTAVMRADEKDVIRSARQSVQSYRNPDHVDLAHFAILVGSRTQSPDVREAGGRLVQYIQTRLVSENATTGQGLGDSHGVAVYLPRGAVHQDYAQLSWARDSNWPAFAAWVSGVVGTGQQQQRQRSLLSIFFGREGEEAPAQPAGK